MVSSLPSSCDTGLAELESLAIHDDLVVRKKKKPQTMYTAEDRYKIAKYASVHGANKAAIHFQSEHATIRKLTVRGFLKKYKQLNKEAHTFKRSPEKIMNLHNGIFP